MAAGRPSKIRTTAAAKTLHPASLFAGRLDTGGELPTSGMQQLLHILFNYNFPCSSEGATPGIRRTTQASYPPIRQFSNVFEKLQFLQLLFFGGKMKGPFPVPRKTNGL